MDLEDLAEFSGSPITIVGQNFAEDCDAAGSVALVEDLVVGLGPKFAGPLLDGLVDRFGRHAGLLGAIDRVAQGQVRGGVAAAFGGDNDQPRKFAEELAALLVDQTFFEGDVRPVGMAGHLVAFRDSGVGIRSQTTVRSAQGLFGVAGLGEVATPA